MKSLTGLKLNQIVKESTAQEKVYEQLKQSILSGEINKDLTFTETELAKSFGTSRTPVRAAIQDLLLEGLLVTIPRKGFKVRQITSNEQAQIFLLRISIESEIIQRVTEVVTVKQIQKIKDIYNEQEKAMLNKNEVEFINLDQQFHTYLVDIAGYDLIKEVLLNLQNLTTLIGLKAIGLQGRMKYTLLEHYKIISALESKNGELASKLMKEHLIKTNQALLDLDSSIN